VGNDSLTAAIEKDSVLRCQKGDKEAFRRVLDIHGDHLFRTALLITRNRSLAEEAVQETLITAWKEIRSFKAGTNLRAWLNRLLISRVSRLTRRKQLPLASEEMAFGVSDPAPTPEQHTIHEETRAELQSALRMLPVDYRTVLVLRFFNDLSLQEIAESTGWREGTVKSRLHRAISALRETVVISERVPVSSRFAREEARL
jgi:RNA polymerase sigma-70 factor (ECF subfamily)